MNFVLVYSVPSTIRIAARYIYVPATPQHCFFENIFNNYKVRCSRSSKNASLFYYNSGLESRDRARTLLHCRTFCSVTANSASHFFIMAATRAFRAILASLDALVHLLLWRTASSYFTNVLNQKLWVSLITVVNNKLTESLQASLCINSSAWGKQGIMLRMCALGIVAVPFNAWRSSHILLRRCCDKR